MRCPSFGLKMKVPPTPKCMQKSMTSVTMVIRMIIQMATLTATRMITRTIIRTSSLTDILMGILTGTLMGTLIQTTATLILSNTAMKDTLMGIRTMITAIMTMTTLRYSPRYWVLFT